MGIIIFCIVWAVGAVAIAKNVNTCRNQILIDRAVYLHRIDVINNSTFPYEFKLDYSDEEDYDKTMWRLWDWGYTRILPPEKFEIAKPYIEEAKKLLKEEKKW